MENISVDQMSRDLVSEGWRQSRIPNVWKSPSGKLFLGPFGAWKAMRNIGDSGKHAEFMDPVIVTRRP